MKALRIPNIFKRSALREKKNEHRLSRLLAAVAVTVICFFIGSCVFFPTDMLKDRLIYEAAQNSVDLEIDALSLLFPPRLKAQKIAADFQLPGRSVEKIDSLTMKPLWGSLFGENPGTAFSAKLRGGQLEGTAHRDGSLDLQAQELSFAEPLLKGAALKVEGLLSRGEFSGQWPMTKGVQSSLSIELDNVALTGLEAMGVKGGNLSLGTIVLKGRGKGKTFRIASLEASGGNLSATGNGTILLATPLNRSRINFNIKVQPGANMDKSLTELMSLLVKPGRDGTFNIRLSGTLANPRML